MVGADEDGGGRGARRPRYLLIEPFLAGSHAAFVAAVTAGVDADWTVLGMPGRHWKWRMRGCVPWLLERHRAELEAPCDALLASSYLPLAELRGLCPALASVPAALYFHENQLAYPARAEHAHERDHHFGVTQLTAALAADLCAFNSAFNRDSLLTGARALLEAMPDARPRAWVDAIAGRSEVWGFPVEPAAGEVAGDEPAGARAAGPLLLWNHRWEHDKAPEVFVAALRELVRRGVPFRVALAGQRFGAVPPELEGAAAWLGDRLAWRGFAGRADYEALLRRAHVCVSAARHEFFGVAVVEAMDRGVRPLVPDRLAYRETVPAEFRYRGDGDLAGELERLCRGWVRGEVVLRADRRAWTARFAAGRVTAAIGARLRALAASR